MSNAADLNWDNIKRFTPGEWPPGVLNHMQGRIILALSSLRNSLPADHRMTPSPLVAAHIRDTGTSRHSLTGGRLSDATDIYMDQWEHAYAAWEKAVSHPEIGGVGFYLDKWLGRPGNVKPMLHFDGRKEKMLWVCHRVDGRDVYVYHHRDPALFHQLMGRRR